MHEQCQGKLQSGCSLFGGWFSIYKLCVEGSSVMVWSSCRGNYARVKVCLRKRITRFHQVIGTLYAFSRVSGVCQVLWGWSTGLLVHWSPRPLVSWSPRPLVSSSTGLLVHWSPLPLASSSTGLLVHWSTDLLALAIARGHNSWRCHRGKDRSRKYIVSLLYDLLSYRCWELFRHNLRPRGCWRRSKRQQEGSEFWRHSSDSRIFWYPWHPIRNRSAHIRLEVCKRRSWYFWIPLLHARERTLSVDNSMSPEV